MGTAGWRKQGELLFVVVLIIAGVMAVLFFALKNPDGPAEIGGQEVPLTFKVVDGENQQPIANASVRIMTDNDTVVARGLSAGRTDREGNVSLRPELIFTSINKNYRRSGGIRFWGKGIEAKADGYLPLAERLETYVGLGMPLFDPPPPPITIQMKRVQPPKE